MKPILYFLTPFLFMFLWGCNESCSCEIDSAVISRNDSLLNMITANGRLHQIHKHHKIPDVHNTTECYQLSRRDGFGKCMTYRVSHNNSIYTFLYKINNRKIQDSSTITNKIRQVDSNTFMKIKKSIDSSCYWTMSVDEDEKLIFDGETWDLEGYTEKPNRCTSNKYHLVSRLSPDSSAFKNICMKLINLNEE